MPDPLDVGNGLIGGGGITYTYTDFELNATVGDGVIDAPDIDISLSAQTASLRFGGGTIGAGLPDLGFDDYSAEFVTGAGTISAGPTELRDIVRALFPALSPSSRNFTPPEYAVSSYKTINGDKSRRLWANQPGGASLDLEFVNLDDDDAESILAAHDTAKGAASDLILPDAVFSGADGDLLTYMRSPGGQAWAFDGAPEVQSVKEGISTVRVKLSARRKVQFDSVGSVGSAFAVGAAPVDEVDPISFADCDFIGRAPEDGPNPRPGTLWVSKLAAGGAYTIGDAGSVEHDLLGNSYHVLRLNSSGSRLAIIKRSRAGTVLWQRISNAILTDFYFADIKPLVNGNIVIYAAGLALGQSRQRLFLFSASGALLRSRSFEFGWPEGMRLRDQTSAQVWGGDAGILGSGRPLLLTVSLADSAAFGDVIDFRRYDTPGSSTTSQQQRARDVRRLSNGNLIMLAEFRTPNIQFHCLELSGDGASVVRAAALETSPSQSWIFSQAIPYSDGSAVLTATSVNRAIRIDSSFNVTWFRQAEIPGDGPMYAVLDSSENLYYAARVAGGTGGVPGFAGSRGASIQVLNSTFTGVTYSTHCNNGDGPSSYSFRGTNSGFDFVNSRFIGCSGNGNNVASHNIFMPSTAVNLSLSGGQTASVGTQPTVAAPTAETTVTMTRTVPTITITTPTLSYATETWTFTDPGTSLAWDLAISP